MKDWKQEIAEVIRARCDHESGSMIIGAGCPDCQGMYMDILWIMNSALVDLVRNVRTRTYAELPADMIEEFRRSIP